MSKDDSYAVIQLSEEIINKLEAELAELKAKGVTLKNGNPIKDVNDVLTYMLDRVEPILEKKTPEPPKRKEGWQRPLQSRKFHYYVEGRSLCGGWGFPDYNNIDADTGDKEAGKEDCAACFRKLVKRRKKLGVEKIEL